MLEKMFTSGAVLIKYFSLLSKYINFLIAVNTLIIAELHYSKNEQKVMVL